MNENQKKIDDGGQAFPMVFPIATAVMRLDGMTLRDYFAAKAMAGYIASFANPSAVSDPKADLAARKAYAYADAMLAARKGTP